MQTQYTVKLRGRPEDEWPSFPSWEEAVSYALAHGATEIFGGENTWCGGGNLYTYPFQT